MSLWEPRAAGGEAYSAHGLGFGFCQIFIHLKGKEEKGHFRKLYYTSKGRMDEKFGSIVSKI